MTDMITVTGNVATDPEHKRTPAGVAITTFRVASGQRRYDRNSASWVDSGTNWYTVSTFRSLADHAFHSLRKGDRVILSGRLRLREWDTGTKRGISVEIDAESIGHDLLWGTTTFERDAAAGAAAAPPAAVTEWPTAQPAGDWAALGSTPQLVLVGAEAGEDAPDEPSDTPF